MTEPDSTKRVAAIWATVVAVPVAVLVAVLFMPKSAPAPEDEPARALPSTPVEMAAPKLAEPAARACLAVTSQLPARVRDLPARRVSDGPEQNAAYGEPPITVSCGVPVPSMCESLEDRTPGCVPLDADLIVKMNRVCWFPVTAEGRTTFTTLDREVGVQVSVPSSYEQAGQWANEFSDTVVKTVRSRTTGLPKACA